MNDSALSHRPHRSMMLVTGANRDTLHAALQSEADMICLDLEDTVADKDAAYALIPELLEHPTRAMKSIRLNPLSTEEGLKNLLMVRNMKTRPDVVKLTMVSDPYEVKLAASLLPGMPLVVIVETALALQRAQEIASAAPEVLAISLGGKDLSNALGCARNWQGLQYARGRVAHAAAVAGVHALDEPYRPLDDLEGLKEHCQKIRDMGFVGKTTVDLRHISIINQAFS